MNRDYPNYRIAEIGQNTVKIRGELRRLEDSNKTISKNSKRISQEN